MLHFVIFVLIGVLIPAAAHAEPYHLFKSGWNCQGFLYCTPDAAPPDDIIVIITTTIVTGVVGFIGALAIVVFFYGAIRMVISRGQEGKEAGKKALMWASLGLIAAMLTQAILLFIRAIIMSIV